MTPPKVGDRETCRYGTRSVPVCGVEIELRQGPNPALPPGWFETATGAPHSCRSWCYGCQRKVGGADRHGAGCPQYAGPPRRPRPPPRTPSPNLNPSAPRQETPAMTYTEVLAAARETHPAPCDVRVYTVGAPGVGYSAWCETHRAHVPVDGAWRELTLADVI